MFLSTFFPYYSWILIQFIHVKWEKVQKATVLRKVALHLFVKKKQKWDKNLVEHHVREWWLHARDGGCMRGMVAAREGWWLRARDGGCV